MYFDVLITKMIMKLGANLIFMKIIKTYKNYGFSCLSREILKISKNVLNKSSRSYQNTHFMSYAFLLYD